MGEETAPVRQGDVLAGKYRVERVLGVGGMGVVVAATHLQLDQRVALKFLLPSALALPEVVARFAREARAAAKIQSEHVARVIDVGTLPAESGRIASPYMVMEFLEGEDLAEVLASHNASGKRLGFDEVARWILEACEALAEAHAAGIVHRDLKPANLFLARRTGAGAVVKVLDFGISKLTAEGEGGLTKTSALIGSPLYMSPEQLVSAKGVDARSDIWALGVVMYELLGARPPFLGETMPEIVARIMHVPLESLQKVRPDCPSALVAVVTRCLEKDAGARFQNVLELASALAPFAPERDAMISVERISRVLGVAPAPVTRATHPVSAPAAAMTAGAFTSAPDEPKRKAPLAVVGAFGVLLVVVAVVAVRTEGPAGAKPAPKPEETLPPKAEETPPKASSSAVPSASATAVPEPATKGSASMVKPSVAIAPKLGPKASISAAVAPSVAPSVAPPAAAPAASVAPPPPPKNPLDMAPK